MRVVCGNINGIAISEEKQNRRFFLAYLCHRRGPKSIAKMEQEIMPTDIMEISTDGPICSGVGLEDGIVLPWDLEYGGNIESWWLFEVTGFKPISTNEDQYLRERDEFVTSHQMLLVDIVNVSCKSHPVWIVAIPDSILKAKRGYPHGFNPMELAEKAPLRWNVVLSGFCEEYDIKFRGVPRWYLSSYWSQ